MSLFNSQLKYDSLRENRCVRVLLFSLFAFVSAFSEEELILDEPEAPKIEKSLPQNKTKMIPKVEKVPSQNSTPPTLTKGAQGPGAKESFLTEATKLIGEKKYSAATAILWENIEHLREIDLILLTKAHYLNKDYFEATKAANLVLAKNETNFEALTYLGLCQLRRKKDREAKEFFKRATEANPVYLPAINGLVEIYERNSNYYELRLIYQDLMKRVGEKSEFLTRLCDIDTKDGITDQAQLNCRKAIQSNPKIPENYSNLGLVYKNIHDMTKAKEQLKMAAEKFPNSDINQLNYAQFLEEQKNFIEAFKYYSRCNKINNFIEKCWVGYTSSSYQIQKFAETLVGLKKACVFNKKHLFLGRQAASFARSVKQTEWAKKLDALSEICGN